MARQEMPFVEFAVEDSERALDFYSRSFNWSYFRAPVEHPFYVLGELEGPAMAGVLAAAFAPHTLVFFPTTDFHATVERIGEHGGHVIEAHPEDGLGMVAQWRDPSGNRFGLTEVIPDAPMARVDAESASWRPARDARRVHARPAYAEVAVDEADVAAEFYERVFGWTTVRVGAPMDYRLTGEPGRPAFAALRPAAFAPRTIPYFHTSDLKRMLGRIRKNGGRIFEPRRREGVGSVAECKDLDGNAFGLVEFGDDSAATTIPGHAGRR